MANNLKQPLKRASYSISDKLKIINRIENGEKKAAIASDLKTAKTTISTIWKDRDKIKAHGITHNPNFKKVRHSDYENIDTALHEWFNLQRARNLPINGPILIGKAKEIATQLNETGFHASDGWLENWKFRHGIKFKVAAGEGAAVIDSIPDEWLKTVWPSLRASYDDSDIFNADETGLFYRLLPNKTMEYKGKECHGGKQSKERLTVLLCANGTGTEKLKPLIIGKSQRPRCFKNIRDLSALPVTYYANKSAWMTADIFSKWLREVNQKMNLANRKILLVLDNCSPHVAADLNLSCIKVVFLPPNVTSRLQPLDRGIINSFKVKYRRSIIEKIITHFDSGAEETFTIDVLQAIYCISSSWNQVTPDCIGNCFKNAGIIAREAQEEECQIVSDDSIPNFRDHLGQEDFNFEDYCAVDENVLVFAEPSTSQIVAAQLSENEAEMPDETAGKEEEDDEEEVEKIPIKSGQALKIIDDLRFYLISNNQSENCSLLDEIERNVLSCSANSMKQPLISDYFRKT